ncbi:hypothetical protein [Chelativorans sp. J32]|uniref:hypothetical protein n=1 Tax=Chelativorans sp. J32 TaxID=935840 RepID=UPI0004B31847|nr:hypothetical protein [Chelativorans sp. J32]
MPRQTLEERVLTGLKERMMAPEAAEAALRAYAEENNRLNRERRAGMERDRAELTKVDRAIKEIVDIMEGGGILRALMDRLRDLEAKQDMLREQIEAARHPLPDIHPYVAQVYRRKIERKRPAEAVQPW